MSLTFLAFLATGVLGVTGTTALDDYATALAPALAAVACFRARGRARGRSARAWLLMGLSLSSSAAGGVAWAVYEVQLGRAVPFPSLADVGYLMSVPLAVAALLGLSESRATGAARLRPLLDGVITAGALLFVSWATVLGPTFHTGSGSLFTQSISLAYPATDVLTATIALLVLARARGRHRVIMLLISTGLILVTVADSTFTWFFARGSYAAGNLFDTGYVAGFLLIGLAALQPPSGRARDSRELPSSRLSLGLPYAPLLISIPFAVVLQMRGHPLGSFLFYDSLIVIVAILVRQLLSLQVNSALTGQLHDTVAALRQREVELHHQAFHDPLTGLANRALFADRIGHALARTRRPGPVMLLLADLDDFKTVNDSLGHPAGDALLIAVAERLRAVVRPEDTVARLGGDEFAVLLEAADDLTDAQQIATRIAQALVQPFHLVGAHPVVGASIGIACAGVGSSGESMLRDADIAMYAAKAEGKGGYTVYAAELAAANIGRVQLRGDLSEALARGELSLKYQPIIDLGSGRLSGVEALLRWQHPTRGDIPPSVFVPIAEATGAILPIGRWVLAEACAQAGRWHRRPGALGLQLAVNVSGRQLGDPQLIHTVRTALATAGLPARLLTLEITESLLIDDDDVTMERLLALHALGLQLAIDDFGTGHSSLSRLRRYPIDTLKVDQSFIAAMTQDAPAPDVLITAILALGHGLGMGVIAEGVETEGQLCALRSLGCPHAQGFLFARPADPDVIDELIRAGITLADPALRL